MKLPFFGAALVAFLIGTPVHADETTCRLLHDETAVSVCVQNESDAEDRQQKLEDRQQELESDAEDRQQELDDKIDELQTKLNELEENE